MKLIVVSLLLLLHVALQLRLNKDRNTSNAAVVKAPMILKFVLVFVK